MGARNPARHLEDGIGCRFRKNECLPAPDADAIHPELGALALQGGIATSPGSSIPLQSYGVWCTVRAEKGGEGLGAIAREKKLPSIPDISRAGSLI